MTGTLAGYIALSPAVAQPLYNKLLFYPDYPVRYEQQHYQLKELEGVPKQDAFIPTSLGTKLHAWYFKNPRATKLVILDHGNAGNLSDRTGLAADLIKMGVSVLLYDYQGYGLSEGKPSIPNICLDGLSVFDYAREKLGYSPLDIILYGESLGCAVACNTAGQRPCAALILQSGFSSLKAIASEKFLIFNLYPSSCFPKPHLDNLACLRKEHPPLLLIHGRLDQTIPVSHSEKMFREACQPKQLLVLPNSGHFVAESDNEKFTHEVAAFIGLLRAAPTIDSALASRWFALTTNYSGLRPVSAAMHS